MDSCPSCRTPVSSEARYCSVCGAPLRSSDAITFEATAGAAAVGVPAPRRAVASSPPSAPRLPGSPPGAGGDIELAPGALLADRYRIVALLGRGGMGEVYRADDLKLGQAVALKFLPRTLERDPRRLDRFLNEVRIARDVSHPNVCRVYDVGDVEGRHFLSMEYIDGEDLASLLRRIGRLPADKAIDIARQLCAGLAAAHDKGVLHRDLKPANVMLDGRGKVRLTDFGLAEAAGSGGGELAGTPAYMAPEQFAAQPATVQTDLYALGLLLYELFTGKRVFTADTIAELRRLHEQSRPPSLSSAVHDVDPAVERVILRCLEKDPRNRPASALAVSAALPGGDPLAAALAAGETPSPDMVAAAGEEGTMRPGVAAAWLAAVIVGLVVAIVLSARTSVLAALPLDYSPDVLANKAQEMLARLGARAPAVQTAENFEWQAGDSQYAEARKSPAERAKVLASGHLLLAFWYRVNPELRVAPGGTLFGGTNRITPADPPMTVPGMASVLVDVRGRLLRFETVPSQAEPTAPAVPPGIDWPKVLAETGVDVASAVPTPPAWLPPTWADTRMAWSAKYADLPDVPVRIEAAGYRGRPLYVRVVRPWTSPDRREPVPATATATTANAISLSLLMMALVGSGLVARRNLLLGRGDRRGALRVGLATGALYLASTALDATHVASIEELGVMVGLIGPALFIALWTGLLYLAIEPYVRRLWPHTLISWNRLLIGRFRDPLLGRDVLFGAAAAVALSLVSQMLPLLARPADRLGTDLPRLLPLLGTRFLIDSVLATTFGGLFSILMLAFLLFVFRLVLRRDYLAVAGFIVLLVVQEMLRHAPAVGVASSLVVGTTMIVVLLRVGLVAFGVTQVFFNLLGVYPFATDLFSWHGAPTLIIGGILIAVVAAAFRLTTSGQSLLGTALDRSARA